MVRKAKNIIRNVSVYFQSNEEWEEFLREIQAKYGKTKEDVQ
jgi:hypothetical protein